MRMERQFGLNGKTGPSLCDDPWDILIRKSRSSIDRFPTVHPDTQTDLRILKISGSTFAVQQLCMDLRGARLDAW